jgi:hypothetical protein
LNIEKTAFDKPKESSELNILVLDANRIKIKILLLTDRITTEIERSIQKPKIEGSIETLSVNLKLNK